MVDLYLHCFQSRISGSSIVMIHGIFQTGHMRGSRKFCQRGPTLARFF